MSKSNAYRSFEPEGTARVPYKDVNENTHKFLTVCFAFIYVII